MRILKSPVRTLTQISLSDLSPNPAQPRRTFSEAAIDALAESIREHGLLSPLLVRRVGPGKYELIAGERRLRALKKLGRTRAEAIIVAAYDMQSAILALIENIQREQLHFLEEARACRAILDSEGMPQEELARQLGRSPSALANRLRLLHLTAETQQAVVETGLTERHARALLAVTDAQNSWPWPCGREKAASPCGSWKPRWPRPPCPAARPGAFPGIPGCLSTPSWTP